MRLSSRLPLGVLLFDVALDLSLLVTQRGRAFLRAETESWLRYAKTVSAILTEPA